MERAVVGGLLKIRELLGESGRVCSYYYSTEMTLFVFILAGIEIVFGSFLQAFHISNIFPTLIILSFVGGTMGIVGGAVGRVAGGIIMIIGGIFALLGAGLFGFLGLVLLVVGGGLAFREASISRQRQEAI